jgi:hypothetical protein
MGPVYGRTVVVEIRAGGFHSVLLRMPAAWSLMQGVSRMIGVLHRRIMADNCPTQVKARPKWIRLGVLLDLAVFMAHLLSSKDACGMYSLVVLFRA